MELLKGIVMNQDYIEPAFLTNLVIGYASAQSAIAVTESLIEFGGESA